MTLKITQPKLLIVEGRDEENFFNAAIGGYLNIVGVQVLPIGGKTLLNQNLKLIKKDSKFSTVTAIGVIRDADLTVANSALAAAAAAFQAVCSTLVANGIPAPAAHAQFAPGPPKTGVFIMPDGASDGMLETLCLASAAAAPEFACVGGYFVCLASHVALPANMDKARAHAWLASRPEPDKRVGEAALANYWSFADAAFVPLWAFLQAL